MRCGAPYFAAIALLSSCIPEAFIKRYTSPQPNAQAPTQSNPPNPQNSNQSTEQVVQTMVPTAAELEAACWNKSKSAWIEGQCEPVNNDLLPPFLFAQEIAADSQEKMRAYVYAARQSIARYFQVVMPAKVIVTTDASITPNSWFRKNSDSSITLQHTALPAQIAAAILTWSNTLANGSILEIHPAGKIELAAAASSAKTFEDYFSASRKCAKPLLFLGADADASGKTAYWANALVSPQRYIVSPNATNTAITDGLDARCK